MHFAPWNFLGCPGTIVDSNFGNDLVHFLQNNSEVELGSVYGEATMPYNARANTCGMTHTRAGYSYVALGRGYLLVSFRCFSQFHGPLESNASRHDLFN